MHLKLQVSLNGPCIFYFKVKWHLLSICGFVETEISDCNPNYSDHAFKMNSHVLTARYVVTAHLMFN